METKETLNSKIKENKKIVSDLEKEKETLISSIKKKLKEECKVTTFDRNYGLEFTMKEDFYCSHGYSKKEINTLIKAFSEMHEHYDELEEVFSKIKEIDHKIYSLEYNISDYEGKLKGLNIGVGSVCEVIFDGGWFNPIELNCVILGFNKDTTSAEVMVIENFRRTNYEDKYLKEYKIGSKHIVDVKYLKPVVFSN